MPLLGAVQQLHQCGFVDHLDAKLLRLLQFTARVASGNEVRRLFRDAVGDLPAVRLDELRRALAGKRLKKIAILKDYWFDWKAYHPTTGVYLLGER